jgi:hypothetical protein
MDADVVTLAPIDRALLELAEGPLTDAKLDALTVAWIKLDAREQTMKLRYFHEDTTLGRHLRAALWTQSARHDLGVVQENFDAFVGRPWP